MNNNLDKNDQKKQLIQKKKSYQRRRSVDMNILTRNKTILKKSNIKKPVSKKYQSIQNIQSSKVQTNIKALKSCSLNNLRNSGIIKKSSEKSFSSNIIKENIKKEKFKKTDLKSLFNKHMILELEEKKEKNSTIKKKNSSSIKDDSEMSSDSLPKKKKTKKNKDDFFLDYVNKNIRNHNTILNNPAQFYNGFFIDIMKRVNESKIKKKDEVKDEDN